jgi:putative membrane protein
MTADLILAILHHLLIFLMAGMLAAEFALVRHGMGREAVARLGRIDGAYGGLAGAIILIGIGRVIFGLKGWEYYVYYWAFWAKMAALVAVGLLSTLPTARITKWRRAAGADAGFAPAATEVDAVRNYLWAEAAVFALIPIFAAIMARGIGY